MQVELLYHTPDPERAIATAARLCYAPVGAAELMETMPEERVKSVLSTIMSAGHTSTLEHASYTFAVDGVSRALTHQLVRHRIASFNQQSQRYVKFTDGLATVKPESVAANEETNAVFDEAIVAAIEAYEKLLAAGRSRRGRALPAAERGRDEDRHHDERARAAALLQLALLQPRAVGDPRDGAPHAGVGEAHGAVHLHGRRRALHPRQLPRRQDDLREPVPAREKGLAWPSRRATCRGRSPRTVR